MPLQVTTGEGVPSECGTPIAEYEEHAVGQDKSYIARRALGSAKGSVSSW
jgi:hypothetical protein